MDMNMDMKNAALYEGRIAIEYVSYDIICYVCRKGECPAYGHKQFLVFTDEEAQQDWFKFTCNRCDATRMIQLERVRGLKKDETHQN
jgi:Zn finger protein HypA/HybF involved in hydrogenase expression